MLTNLTKKPNNLSKKSTVLSPALYIVPTPVGNLEDITVRALTVLKNADIIACEDTRRAGMLLKLLNVVGETAAAGSNIASDVSKTAVAGGKINNNVKFVSYHDYNEAERTSFLVNEIAAGKIAALISDAGTPCISDPGYKLVAAAIAAGITVVPLPGATAFVPALVASGFAVHRFTFFGFPPQKKGRQTFIADVLQSPNTAILYESSHRITKLLAELAAAAGSAGRNICVAREISKVFEQFYRFNTADYLSGGVTITEKGEFVVVVEAAG